MIPNKIEQAVMELCDAVPSWAIRDATISGINNPAVYINGVFIALITMLGLPVIAQHAKHYAAKQGWMPHTLTVAGYSLCFIRDPVSFMDAAMDKTACFSFDPTQLGSEELQWIRAVTEVAKLITNQGAMK